MNKIIYAFLVSLILCFASVVYAKGTQKDLQENVVRLHIIANSDSVEDQTIKLKVRDAILVEVRENGGEISKEKFIKTSNKILESGGFSYKSEIEFGFFSFPQKRYKDLVFPAGEYKGMRVILGEGKGQNWWCVMNPPLCFTENTEGQMSDNGKEEMKERLDSETYDIITDKKKIKFKIVEIVNTIIKSK